MTEKEAPSKHFRWFTRHENIILIVLFALFIAMTLPGISNVRNPDEIAHRVHKALIGEWTFDETNFDYPSLPKYVMFAAGQVSYSFGYAKNGFYVVARALSVLLGGLIIVLSYKLTRKLGGDVFTATLASLLIISSSEFAINARFAHNDLYLIFFLLLTIYAAVQYRLSASKLWIYASFLFAGMAVSSKYNGISMIALPFLVFLFENRAYIRERWLSLIESLFIGSILVFLGYAIGTPKALFWMSYYFKRAVPSILKHASYGRQPDSIVGLIGQWGVMLKSFSAPVFVLFLAAIVYLTVSRIQSRLKRKASDEKTALSILFLAILLFDLPIVISYNVQARFFLAFIPLLSILTALAVQEWAVWLGKYRVARKVFLGGIAFVIVFGILRVTSIALLIKNDARDAAGEFIATLPVETSLEYTMYPPRIPEEHFEREHNYPVFFVKFQGQEVPEVQRGKPYRAYNQGEKGLLARETDYLVIDNFTYDRFSAPYICESNAVECEFFEQLLAGETSYQLIRGFSYSLPKYLPQISVAFVNPSIQVFERTH